MYPAHPLCSVFTQPVILHFSLLPLFLRLSFLPSNFTLTYTSCLACPLPLPPSLWALARGVRRFQLTKQKPCSPPPPLPLFKHQPVFLSSSCCCTANNRMGRRENQRHRKKERANTRHFHDFKLYFLDASLHWRAWPPAGKPGSLSKTVISFFKYVSIVSFRKFVVSSQHSSSSH